MSTIDTESTEMANEIPEGYLRNTAGHLVPKKLVKEIDIARDDLVREIFQRAEETRKHINDFKNRTIADLMAFVDLSAEKYNAKMGGVKGNISFNTFDGEYKIQIAVAERMTFDERLHAAKVLIDKCIHRWAEGVNPEIKALVEYAFQTDKEGQVSVSKVCGLTQLEINDEEWRRAMDAIRDSMHVIGSTKYMRLYRKKASGGYERVSMDASTI